MTWDPDNKLWVRGQLDEKSAEWLVQDIHRHCSRGGHAEAAFSVWKDRGGEFANIGEANPEPQIQEVWVEVADRAQQFLLQGRETGTITRKEELGYMGAIAILKDRKSRPADKKSAIDLIMKLEGVFEERNKGVTEGEEAKGTKQLIDELKGTDGQD